MIWPALSELGELREYRPCSPKPGAGPIARPDPAFGCRGGAFRPSCRQIRSTRLSLTTQPYVLPRSAIIFR